MTLPSLHSTLLSSVLDLLPTLAHYRPDLAFADATFVELGLRRVLETVQSGRDFLQQARSAELSDVSLRAYFGALHSPRRGQLLTELNAAFLRQLHATGPLLPDRFAGLPELRGRGIFALDGHFIQPASHEAPRPTARGEEQVPPSCGVFWRDLRYDTAGLLAQTVGHEHEWAAVQRTPWRDFPGYGSAGTLLVIDAVAVDFAFLTAAKYRGGFFVITRSKENLRPTGVRTCLWDELDPRNAGVLADERVRFAGCPMELRRVRYRDPETGQEYEFLTTDLRLPPGLIALLYLRRWDIEKLFDVFETKLAETKAWATGAVAGRSQNELVVLAFNAALRLQTQVAQQDGIRDEKVEQKQAKALKQRAAAAAALGRRVSQWVQLRYRPTQLSCQFLRWLRDGLRAGWTWVRALHQLRPLMQAYLR